MKNRPIITLLVVGACGLAILVLGLAFFFEFRFRQLRRLQPQAAACQNNRSVITMLANDAVEYSKAHPSIDPLLQTAGAKPGKAALSPINKPPGK